MKKIFVQCDDKPAYFKLKEALNKKGVKPLREDFQRNEPVFVQVDDSVGLFSTVSQACVKGNYILNFNDLIFE